MKKLIYNIIFLLSRTAGLAQTILRYTNQNTFPQVFDIQQDKGGFIWFSSNRQIIKYNSLEYQVDDRSKLHKTKDSLITITFNQIDS